jgi:hypothetical protein
VPQGQVGDKGSTGLAGLEEGKEVIEEESEGRRQAYARVLHGIELFFPGFAAVAKDKARELVSCAYEWADRQYGIQEAREWAQGFTIAREIVEQDMRALEEAGGDLIVMAERARARRKERLSAETVETVLSRANPEWAKMMEIARDGVEVLRPQEFVVSGMAGRPPLRKKLVQAGGAVERMIVENFRMKGLAAILPVEVVERLEAEGQQVHLHTLSHATKHESKKGRNVGDLGVCGEGTPLNSDETKEMADVKWGRIVNITLQNLVDMISDFWEAEKRRDPAARWEDVVLWKMDLSGAYTLVDLAPRDVPVMAAEMQGGMIVFFYCGLFGWSCMPAAFQVINRSIVWELKQPAVLQGDANMYVDDIAGVTMRRNVGRDMSATRTLVTKLLGKGAIEEKKSEWGRRLTFIGWDLDLDKRLVTLARKNALKALYGLATEGAMERVPMAAIQRWASWAERYGEICLFMKPFRRVLYGAVRRDQEHKAVRLAPEVRRVVRLYTALMALTVVREQSFTRSLESFSRKAPTLVIQFDGSLGGVGVTWFEWRGQNRTEEAVLGGTAVSLGSLQFGGDSSFQNCCEFIGALVGILGALQEGWDTTAIWLRGDSSTALAWVEGGRYRSDNVLNAATVMSMVCAMNDVRIVGTELWTSEKNWACDELSRMERGKTWEEAVEPLATRDERYKNMREVRVRGTKEMVELCNPRRKMVSEEDFGKFWRDVYSFCCRMKRG